MDFYNRVNHTLLAHNEGLSYCKMAEAHDRLWGQFVSAYLETYAYLHVINGEVHPQTIATKHDLRLKLKREWFIPRALKSYKFMMGIDDSVDVGARQFTWFDIKPERIELLVEVYDLMLQRVEKLIHEDSVFFYHIARDCDQCESDGIVRFDSWYRAAEWITQFYDSLEGPGDVAQVTLKQYLTFERSVRDHRAEQYNY